MPWHCESILGEVHLLSPCTALSQLPWASAPSCHWTQGTPTPQLWVCRQVPKYPSTSLLPPKGRPFPVICFLADCKDWQASGLGMVWRQHSPEEECAHIPRNHSLGRSTRDPQNLSKWHPHCCQSCVLSNYFSSFLIPVVELKAHYFLKKQLLVKIDTHFLPDAKTSSKIQSWGEEYHCTCG